MKGRNTFNAIIVLWEVVDYDVGIDMDYVFSKVKFDKAYVKIDWVIVESLHELGLG